MDCHPRDDHSAHDGVGNQVFLWSRQSQLSSLEWHRGGVFLKALVTHGTVYYLCLCGIRLCF